MYSGEGACMLVEENVSGGEKLGLHGKKKMRSGALEKKSACVCVYCECTFAWYYNARLRSCERTFAGVITSVRWFSNVRLRVL